MPAVVPPRPRLLDRFRDELCVRHYSPLTEEAYVFWVRRFVRHHAMRHPAELGVEAVSGFLTHLAQEARMAASTQNQALAALLSLYAHVLGRPIEKETDFVRAKRPQRLPGVLSPSEVERVLAQLDGVKRLMAELPYGSGLRLSECVALRVKDVSWILMRIRGSYRVVACLCLAAPAWGAPPASPSRAGAAEAYPTGTVVRPMGARVACPPAATRLRRDLGREVDVYWIVIAGAALHAAGPEHRVIQSLVSVDVVDALAEARKRRPLGMDVQLVDEPQRAEERCRLFAWRGVEIPSDDEGAARRSPEALHERVHVGSRAPGRHVGM